jgi:hypothetical protein
MRHQGKLSRRTVLTRIKKYVNITYLMEFERGHLFNLIYNNVLTANTLVNKNNQYGRKVAQQPPGQTENCRCHANSAGGPNL